MNNLELWGGVESTVNRVKNKRYNQIEKSGHYDRFDDLDLIASLGIKKIRYPVIWELFENDLTWPTQRLSRLRELGIEPIVTLLHHGNGPNHTNLLDPYFPLRLAQFAKKVAKEFPWIKYYTIINEPLTTARFCGMYGIWYPHKTDTSSFGTCFINQILGIEWSMYEILKINPDAILIQTEDVAKVFSTPKVDYQADHENERKWLTFDLLSNNYNPSKEMENYLAGAGFDERNLRLLGKFPVENMILGIDSYINSYRLLDEDLSRYPEHMHVGNGRDAYVDVEAISVFKDALPSVLDTIEECWNRYHLPIALTEAHVHADERGRVNWFINYWNAALEAQQKGIDIRAVTAWALFGLYGWDTLCTGNSKTYEPGVFNVVKGKPKETLLCDVLRRVSKGESLVEGPEGWWKESIRLKFEPR